MVEVWFALLSITLIVFVVLDGWDIGAGVLHWVAGRTSAERREIVAAIGPLWSWHEVWLVAFGGTFLLAFPKVMATSFAGFYLALWLVLWSFILRGVSIEVGGHINDRLWQSWWDFVFAVSNVLLAVLFGAALGNVIRGVPLDESGKFSMSLFTDFGVRGRVGILDWYTVSVAVLHDRAALRAWRYLPATQDNGPVTRAQRTSGAPTVANRMGAIGCGLSGNLGRAACPVRGDGRAASRLACDRGGRGWSLGTLHRVARHIGTSRVRGIVRGDRGSAGRRRGQRVSRDAALDARARALDDRL